MRVIPRRMPKSAARVTTAPSRVTIQALVEEPSVTKPFASTNQASLAPASRAACLASTFGSSPTDLMSTRSQRLSGTEMTGMPSCGALLDLLDVEILRRDDDARQRARRRKRVVAPRDAARHLQIDEAVVHAVARDRLAQHDAEHVARHRHRDAQLAERAFEPVHVAALVDQPPSPHLAHLVDAVGELVAAILDMDLRGAMRHVAAVHIGDA